MKVLPAVIVLLAAGAGRATAEDWTGKLIDAVCSDQQQQQKTVSCDATKSTTVFALDVDGKVYKLDPVGNTKAIAAMKYHPEPDGAQKPIEVKAKVTGTESAGRIVVETIGLVDGSSVTTK